ncbi:hypothetical protein DDR33_11495 [Pararcticibacter amylolyticus]|uniref:Uncharacterized protein n=1 Tax=Pararcticibacter amylolyticus TaxID=2173175 RepID=A0A2U2PGZ6_9SPHI|nr:hypothetical protein DDR33_11495 [Pararcticibacter amylolyticus]
MNDKLKPQTDPMVYRMVGLSRLRHGRKRLRLRIQNVLILIQAACIVRLRKNIYKKHIYFGGNMPS